VKDSFTLILECDNRGPLLRFEGSAGPDYRRYTGVEREALRMFLAARSDAARSFYTGADRFWDRPEDGGAAKGKAAKVNVGAVIEDPDDRLVELAASEGLLRNGAGEAVSLSGERCRCALHITAQSAASFSVSPALLGEDGGDVLEDRFDLVSPRLALSRNKLYPLEDIGAHWKDTAAFRVLIKKDDLTSYLSLMFSRFSNIALRYAGNGAEPGGRQGVWQTRTVRPITAQPALLFMEIDKHEYLHVRPIAYLRDFPPEFLENEEIITAVKMDEREKVFTAAEIVFPEPSGSLFRAAIAKFARRGGMGKAELQKQIYEENGRFIIAPEFAKRFFSECIFDLSAQFALLETKALAGCKVSFAKPRVRLSLGDGVDYLSGSADVEFEGQRFSFAGFMHEYKQAACITLADGTRGFPDKRVMDKLDRLLAAIKGGGVELSFFDLPLLMAEDAVEIDGAAWEKARPFFSGYNSIETRQGRWGLQNGRLRPYQEYGVRWLDYLREYGMGACLADEMGLGKTVQVISLLRALNAGGETGLCLILCPKSVVYNWAAELDKFAPEIPYTVHYGAERDFKDIAQARAFRIVLSTYATLRRDAEQFLPLEFLYVILDESQNIKNLSTQTSGAVLSLKARRRMAMSGTPIENNLFDLYSLFRFLNPGFFGSPKEFTAKYLRPIQEENNEDALQDLKARIYPFILRRLKRDVVKELPAKTEETAYIELDREQLALYHRRRAEYKNLISGIIEKGDFAKSSIVIFKALSELRRLASVPEAEGEYGGPSAKRQYLAEMISGLAQNGHKCLVFANFLAGVELVSQDLAERGIANLTMTGATGSRQALVRTFQTSPDIKAFIMTLKTGGTGINLTAADYIFIMDPWWNSAAEAQAVDRSHRIGQVNPVFCYRLIARGTIEERILELQKRKQELAGALLSDDAGALKRLNENDISFLVGDAAW
ncbi:MAG: DEAD/DEAH box helicase, partial [Treponema sp.]|jgi:superfamily II DNA or RNA helicase|nr:DEAD/DEAH box helicase [Treponema sp.]